MSIYLFQVPPPPFKVIVSLQQSLNAERQDGVHINQGDWVLQARSNHRRHAERLLSTSQFSPPVYLPHPLSSHFHPTTLVPYLPFLTFLSLLQSGSLAVDGGRSLAPLITSLSHLPFPLVVATQDWHPRDHISFATNHPPPNNEPLTSSITLRNPAPQKGGPGEKSQKLWPVHCVQGTEGAEIIEELEGKARIDLRVRKGMEKGMEM